MIETAVKMIEDLEKRTGIKPFVDQIQNGLRLAIKLDDMINAILNNAKHRNPEGFREVDVRGFYVNIGQTVYIVFDIVKKGEKK